MKTITDIKSDFHTAFAEVSTIPGLTVTDTIQIAIAVLGEYGKDRRAEVMKEARLNGYSNGNGQPTPKQIAYLKRLGIEMPEGLTKQQASKLIDEAKNK